MNILRTLVKILKEGSLYKKNGILITLIKVKLVF